MNTKHRDYLTWKRNNVTLRGIETTTDKPNNAGASLGTGLYTCCLSNREMARKYGKVYFVLNGKPKNPIKFQYQYQAENESHDYEEEFQFLKKIFSFITSYPLNRMEFLKYCLLSQGYDGILIKGREMVNYKPENVLYFKTEQELKEYYYWGTIKTN